MNVDHHDLTNLVVWDDHLDVIHNLVHCMVECNCFVDFSLQDNYCSKKDLENWFHTKHEDLFVISICFFTDFFIFVFTFVCWRWSNFRDLSFLIFRYNSWDFFLVNWVYINHLGDVPNVWFDRSFKVFYVFKNIDFNFHNRCLWVIECFLIRVKNVNSFDDWFVFVS